MAECSLLTNSDLCRLCGESTTKNGINLYSPEKNSEQLYLLVNTYLPITVEDGDQYPERICPGCHIQLEATKLFMDLIIQGQAKLRNLLKSQSKLIFREEKERIKLELALQSHNPNTSVETYAIQADEDGEEKCVIQIYSDGPLFAPDQELALKVAGKNTGRRRKGRPRRTQKDQNISTELPDQKKLTETTKDSTDTVEKIVTSRHKRVIKPPTRYDGDVRGNELTKILKDEGVLDEDFKVSLEEKCSSPKTTTKTLIGKVFNANGPLEDEKLVFSEKSYKRQSEQRFECNICKRVFQHYGRCEAHKQSHKVNYRCQAEGCSVQDPERDKVVKHQQETGHTGISVFDSIFQLDGKLILPDDVNINESPSEIIKKSAVKCIICQKEFTCKQNYEVHLKAVHKGEKPYNCYHCDRDFAYAFTFKNHLLCHYRKINGVSSEMYKCQSCEKSFNNPSTLRYHNAKEHANQKFACIKCEKTFKHRQLLRRHQLVHTENKPYQCTECSKRFKTKSSLAIHENIHKELVRYVCPVCGNTFNQKGSLWAHMNIHDDRKFECNVCKKAFTQKSNLIEHIRTHTGEKPFDCTFCEQKFTTSSQCKSHMRRHTGEKPFPCKHCPKRFRHKETLKTHIRRHLNERPFKCRFCPKSFPEQWACTRHERIHLGTIVYKCETCDKGFSDRTNYSKHKKTHLKRDAALQNILGGETGPVMTEKSAVKEEFLKVESLSNDALTESCSEMVAMTDKTAGEVKTIETNRDLHFQLLDEDGNSINLTTADGKSIPIVSSGDKKFEGLLPDGTLVSFDIICDEQAEEQTDVEASEVAIASEVNLLGTAIHYIDGNNSLCTNEREAFLTDDDKVCFITTFDESSFLSIT